jgi:hypothetical protein
MTIKVVEKNSIKIAVLDSEDILIKDVQSAMDLFATVDYETGCDRMIIDKSLICEDFFDLSTKIAGEVLQKFINYHKKLAIVGDFTGYTSKSLRSFIYEVNRGKDIFFLADEAEAIDRLATAK